MLNKMEFWYDFTVFEGAVSQQFFENYAVVHEQATLPCLIAVKSNFMGQAKERELAQSNDLTKFIEQAEQNEALAFLYFATASGEHDRLYVPKNSPNNVLELLYRVKKRMHHLKNAESRLMYLIYGDDAPDDLSDDEKEAAMRTFFEQYPGVDYQMALGMLDCFVERFEDDFDCNIPVNLTWESAITDVLSEQ